MRSPKEIEAAAQDALSMASPCRLCPRECGAHRRKGELGFCGLPFGASLAGAYRHFGEEPPICQKSGAAAFFFASCNLRCSFCQNWQISRRPSSGKLLSSQDLARSFLSFEEFSCSHLDLVSPTPHLPWVLEALALARSQGFSLPVVINSNGYLREEVLEIYGRSSEIVLLDVKFSSTSLSESVCASSDYPAQAKLAAKKSMEIFGPLSCEGAEARSGVLYRHLVLPGMLEDTEAVLAFCSSLGEVSLSLMAQYHPSGEDPSSLPAPLDRCLQEEEYLEAVALAGKHGIDELFFQEPNCGELYLPDFAQKDPFSKARD